MRKFRKVLSVILAAFITFSAFSALPLTASAAVIDGNNAVGEEYGNYEYQILDDGTAEITKYNGEDTEVMIPSEIDGHKVIAIGSDAFSGCSTITSITIPDGIETICFDAFGWCENLKNITIPESVKSIENYLFENCMLGIMCLLN